MKNAFIRVDASIEIGTGHVMRCLTLAEELNVSGYEVTFITSNHTGQLVHLIEVKGFKVIMLEKSATQKNKHDELLHSKWLRTSQEEDAKETLYALKKFNNIDLLVVDHYAIDYRWERMFRNKVNKIFVIDDLADRYHICDVLLDQNFYLDLDNRYKDLVNNDCKLLLGPKYALLRKEFKKAEGKMKIRDGRVSKIFVFFGGSDPTNETIKTLNAIKLLDRQDIDIDVVVGSSNPNKGNIEKLVNKHSNMKYYCQVSNIAELMLNADLAIGAGGSTTWERCYLGLPSITIGVAYNQIEILEAVEKKGAIINLGYSSQVSIEDLTNQIKELLTNKNKIRQLSVNARKLVKR